VKVRWPPMAVKRTLSRVSKRTEKAEIPELELGSRRDWRRWLAKHHATSPGVWLVYYKEHTGVACVAYDDSVREALCFGWIDSLIRRLDEDRYARKFTPRKPGSVWSASNLKRWAELEKDGALAVAGRAASPKGAPRARRPQVPDRSEELERAIRRNRAAWRSYQALPAGERRRFVSWISVAKRSDTRERRIREAITLLAAGERLGLR
jgi:uncharacterized protein YdeI (YjbR/CyaY-like superfamily)